MTHKKYLSYQKSSGYYDILYINENGGKGNIIIKKDYYHDIEKKITKMLKNCIIVKFIERSNEDVESESNLS